MTENYPEVATSETAWGEPTWSSTTEVASTQYETVAPIDPVTPSDSEPGTADVAKDQAADLKQGAVESAQNVAAVAKDQATNVTAEAGQQAKALIGQAQSELSQQAGAQQQKLAGGLHALGDELGSMASHPEQKGVASDLAQQASAKSHEIASWLDDREPGKLLDELRTFARQRPGAFLAVAAGVGLVAGRLTRGLKAASDESSDAPAPAPAALPAATTRPFASSQDAVTGDYPIPAAADTPAWRDETSL